MSYFVVAIANVLWLAGVFALAAALLALFVCLTGLYGAKLFKKLLRVYHLRVIAYWLDRLEKNGVREFERAERLDNYVKALKSQGKSL